MPEKSRHRHPALWGAAIVIAIGILAAGSFALYVTFGGWPMNADINPGGLEAWLGRTARSDWVSAHAPTEKDPVPVNTATLTRGAQLYEANCAVCHGGAHEKTSPLHHAVYPGAPQFLNKPALKGNDDRLFYVIQHGIRFTGMPAWHFNMSDTDIWTVVNLLKHLDSLPPAVEAAWHAAPTSPGLPSASTSQ